MCNGCATFSDLRITDSTYNLIKKAPAVLVVTAPHAPWLQPAMSAPFRVLTKRSLSDKKSAPAHAGGARRPRGTGGADVAKTDAVEALPGLGSRSAQRLRTAGINDCGDLARRVLCDEAGVRRVLGDLSATSKHWRNITESIGAPLRRKQRAMRPASHAASFCAFSGDLSLCVFRVLQRTWWPRRRRRRRRRPPRSGAAARRRPTTPWPWHSRRRLRRRRPRTRWRRLLRARRKTTGGRLTLAAAPACPATRAT